MELQTYPISSFQLHGEMTLHSVNGFSYVSTAVFDIRLVRRRRTPPPPGDFATPNAAGTPPAFIGVRRVFCDFIIFK